MLLHFGAVEGIEIALEVEGVVARGITDNRQKARRELLEKIDTMGGLAAAAAIAGVRRMAPVMKSVFG